VLKKISLGLAFILCYLCTPSFGQQMKSNDTLLNQAYELAVNTVNVNVRRGILAAGGDYGGEWTRDIAINSWNGVSLLKPEVAEKSLWSVTINRDTIGHQYWDKALWIIAAYNHYMVTGNRVFLKQAYQCSTNTIEQLEKQAFDKQYGLFKGPSVFNDGIAGYPEPVYEPGNRSSSVLDHKSSAQIKCLSTNCVYYGAYATLAKMAATLNPADAAIALYHTKALALKQNIIKHLYDPATRHFYYLIDQNGNTHKEQEGLGISLCVLFKIAPPQIARQLTSEAVVSKFGITSIYPDFPRYSSSKPGRHNNIIWPMVNGYFALAALSAEDYQNFDHELSSATHLALDQDKGDYNFREIYNPYSGQPDGGFQDNGRPDFHWESCKLQTWSATAYLAMVLKGIIGLDPDEKRLSIHPYLPPSLHFIQLKDVRYRNCLLDISVTGNGKSIKTFTVDGKPNTQFYLSNQLQGHHRVVINMQ
jgi:hypothetical protein